MMLTELIGQLDVNDTGNQRQFPTTAIKENLAWWTINSKFETFQFQIPNGPFLNGMVRSYNRR